MIKVELIYFSGCPHVEVARSHLIRAFMTTGISARWQEWDVQDPDVPAHVKGYGSPTLLVNGHDVSSNSGPQTESACRLYRSPDGGFTGAPSSESIAAVLRQHAGGNYQAPSRGWGGLAAAPGVGLAILGKFACPACFPAIAALSSSLGLGFLLDSRTFLFLSLTFLGVALIGLGYRARTRRGYGPLMVGALGAVSIVLSSLALESDLLTYGGAALLLGASVWNLWPVRQAKVTANCCPIPTTTS